MGRVTVDQAIDELIRVREAGGGSAFLRVEEEGVGYAGELERVNGIITKDGVEWLILVGEPGCDCGYVLRGVLVSDQGSIEACGDCGIYPGDLEAAMAVALFIEHAKVCFYEGRGVEVPGYGTRVQPEYVRVWDGQDLPPGVFIADGTDPWIEVNGQPITNWEPYAHLQYRRSQ